MESTKRQRQNTIDENDNKKTKSTNDSDSSSRKSISYFDDLSNELIYEVFEFLDFYHVYDAFSDLNTRFHNLLTHSSLPIHINLSCVLKTAFERYYANVIIPYQHRITSLHLSNLFIINHVFSADTIAVIFTRLEKLGLNDFNIPLHRNVLIHLISFPHLSSLTINITNDVQNRHNFYVDIFSLPALKYCKVSCKQYIPHESLPFATTTCSPVEYLIIDATVYLNEINAFFSYLPQLRHLSLHQLYRSFTEQPRWSPMVLNRLTHVSLNVDRLSFDDLESMVRNLFNQVQVLYVTAYRGIRYLDASRWERLIVSSMPYLRIFDISISYSFSFYTDIVPYIALIDQFESLFWTERQWFFEYQTCKHTCSSDIFFYSTNPYRRKHFTLFENWEGNINKKCKKSSMNSVDLVNIVHEEAIVQSRNSFPNATALQISCEFSNEPNSCSSTYLNSFIPLRQLTELVLTSYKIRFSKVIDLLLCMPNLYILMMEPMSCNCTDLLSLEQSEAFQSLSKTNNIKEITLKSSYNIANVSSFWLSLCPRLRHLTIKNFKRDWKEDFTFLSAKYDQNPIHLISLCLEKLTEEHIITLKSLIKLEELPIEIEQSTNNNIYLWW